MGVSNELQAEIAMLTARIQAADKKLRKKQQDYDDLLRDTRRKLCEYSEICLRLRKARKNHAKLLLLSKMSRH